MKGLPPRKIGTIQLYITRGFYDLIFPPELHELLSAEALRILILIGLRLLPCLESNRPICSFDTAEAGLKNLH